MLFDKTHLFLVSPRAIDDALGSGNSEILERALDLIEASELPEDVQELVNETLTSWIEQAPKQINLDLIGTLVLISLVGAVGEPMDIESLEDIPNMHGIIQNLTDRMEYNAMVHLFGNPPTPFRTIDTTGTTLDMGFLDGAEVEELYDELVSIELSDEEIDEFSDEFGFDLVEDFVDPIQETLELAMDSQREVVCITAD